MSSLWSHSFEINFLTDSGDQIAFHFNPRFAESTIICNSFLSNHWGQEERTDTFPLEANESFQVWSGHESQWSHARIPHILVAELIINTFLTCFCTEYSSIIYTSENSGMTFSLYWYDWCSVMLMGWKITVFVAI